MLQPKTTQRLKACDNCGHQKGKHTTGKQASCFYPGCTCQHYTYSGKEDNFLILHSGKMIYKIGTKIQTHQFKKVTAKTIGLTVHSLIHFSPHVSDICIILNNGVEG